MSERRRLLGAASLALLALGAIVVAALLASGQPDRRSSAAHGRVGGLVAELVDRRRPLELGRVMWQARWRLCWQRQAGARDYLVTVVTSEGVDPVPRRTRRRCWSVTVASGSAPPGDVRRQRDDQLDLVEPSLAVSVAARMSDGRIGPASPDIPVGRPYRGGG